MNGNQGQAIGRVEWRMGFSVDTVGYSARSSPDKAAVQIRLATLLDTVVHRIGLAFDEVDSQTAGDGFHVFLPAATELHRTLPALIREWDQRLADDNSHVDDRLRLRMAVVAGPVCTTPLGFGGNTIIEVARLVDSPTLRRAIRRSPRVDLAVLVADQLYRHVVGEGYPGLDAHAFRRRLVHVGRQHTRAWLWTSRPVPTTVRTVRSSSSSPTSGDPVTAVA
jgi:class 3 adenylate cyclase